MPARVVYREHDEKPDESRYEMVAQRVPPSDEYPDGLKYSFQYMDASGDTLLRYDNAPYHLAVGRHHRHGPNGDIEPLSFTTLADLIDMFHTEVNEIYARRTD